MKKKTIDDDVVEIFATYLIAGSGQDSASWTVPDGVSELEYLIIGGGGRAGGAGVYGYQLTAGSGGTCKSEHVGDGGLGGGGFNDKTGAVGGSGVIIFQYAGPKKHPVERIFSSAIYANRSVCSSESGSMLRMVKY